MKTLSIVYFSGSGHTTMMAEAVAKGGGTLEARRGLRKGMTTKFVLVTPSRRWDDDGYEPTGHS